MQTVIFLEFKKWDIIVPGVPLLDTQRADSPRRALRSSQPPRGRASLRPASPAMASETIILDDDYAMAATWAVEHVAALGVLDRAVLTDLFSICDKTRNLPARIEQRLNSSPAERRRRGRWRFPARLQDDGQALASDRADFRGGGGDSRQIRQAVCVRSLDSPAEFAAMVDELFPSKTANALLNAARSDMLHVLDALESGDDRAGSRRRARSTPSATGIEKGHGARSRNCTGRRWAAPRSTGSSTTSPPAGYNPPGPNRAHAAIPRIPAQQQQQPRTGSLSLIPRVAPAEEEHAPNPVGRAQGPITREIPAKEEAGVARASRL